MNRKYVLVGAAGYIAPKHMNAIKETGGELVAIFDTFDSVGIIDSYFPNCRYFNDESRFERYCYKNSDSIDSLVVCSPNFTHDFWCRFGLAHNLDVICEKPLVLTVENFNRLKQAEQESNDCKINTILQLRLSDSLIQLKQAIKTKLENSLSPIDMKIIYNTPRGAWYDYTWKADVVKSGGLASNIGVHLFDIVFWLFDATRYKLTLFYKQERQVSGLIALFDKQERIVAYVEFELSIKIDVKPIRTIVTIDLGSVSINGDEFKNLHIKSYEQILEGNGFGLDDTLQAIKICEEIRNANT